LAIHGDAKSIGGRSSLRTSMLDQRQYAKYLDYLEAASRTVIARTCVRRSRR